MSKENLSRRAAKVMQSPSVVQNMFTELGARFRHELSGVGEFDSLSKDVQDLLLRAEKETREGKTAKLIDVMME